MSRNKAKVTYSEEELKSLINREIKWIVNYDNQLEIMSEYLSSNLIEIISLWCLIYFIRKTGLMSDKLLSYKRQLMVYLFNISRIKVGNHEHFYERKMVITKCFDAYDILSEQSDVSWMWVSRLDENQINKDDYAELIKEICSEFIRILPTIILLLANDDLNARRGVINYVKSL